MSCAEERLRSLLGWNADKVLRRIAKAKRHGKTPVFFTDYDDTVINGDVAESLVEVLIDLGYSQCLAPGEFEKGLKQFQTQYLTNRAQGLAYVLSIFSGADVCRIRQVVAAAYQLMYRYKHWEKMVQLLCVLRELGVCNWVVTASPTLFVEGVKEHLAVDHVSGVEVQIHKDQLTNKATQVPFALGKRVLLEKLLRKNKNLYPVLSAGNTVENDYPFQSLLLGLNVPGLFVLPPTRTPEDAAEAANLGLIPFPVDKTESGPVLTLPEFLLTQCELHCRSKNCCYACHPIIPYEIYERGQIAS